MWCCLSCLGALSAEHPPLQVTQGGLGRRRLDKGKEPGPLRAEPHRLPGWSASGEVQGQQHKLNWIEQRGYFKEIASTDWSWSPGVRYMLNSINELGSNSDKNRKIFKKGMNISRQNPEDLDKGEKVYHLDIQGNTGKVSHLVNLGGIIWGIGLPGGASHEEPACQCKRGKFDPWVRKTPWKSAWQPILVFLPGKFHGQRSLKGYSPWGSKELDTTEATACKHVYKELCFLSRKKNWTTKSRSVFVYSQEESTEQTQSPEEAGTRDCLVPGPQGLAEHPVLPRQLCAGWREFRKNAPPEFKRTGNKGKCLSRASKYSWCHRNQC